jgi:tetratricopeptide (TPR) repeat protein
LKQPENDIFYYQLKNLIAEFSDRFAPNEMHEFYFFAINHCIRRLNDGSVEFGIEAFRLYQTALEAGFLFKDGNLSRFTFHNIVATGLRVGETDRVRDFIQNYQQHLEIKYRDSSVSFNLARLEFAEEKYGQVLQLLQNANYRDPLLNLAAKILLMKTFYTLGELDSLHSHLEAMRNYINRSEVIGYHRVNYLNIIKFMEKVLKINPLDKKKRENLKSKIQNAPILSEREWLLQCVGTLTF